MITIESKSTKGSFETEYSISGKQSSYVEAVVRFKAALDTKFKQYDVKVPKDTKDLGLGSAKKSGVINATTGPKLAGPLQKTVDLFRDSGMRDQQMTKILTECIQAAFPLAKGSIRMQFITRGVIDVRKFYVLWMHMLLRSTKQKKVSM